jgi:hypothetical protein
MCTKYHQIGHNYDGGESCRTHDMKQHDIFISYRVDYEGKKPALSKVLVLFVVFVLAFVAS